MYLDTETRGLHGQEGGGGTQNAEPGGAQNGDTKVTQ